MNMRRRAPLPALVAAGAVFISAGCGSGLSVVEKAALKDSTIVAVFNERAFTIDDFKQAYARNEKPEGTGADTLDGYADFLERWVDFRLKVLYGLEAGYDSDPGINEELSNYRTSYARPFLIDKELLSPILRDLYNKRQEMVEASHILIRMDEDAEPEDTLLAYNRIMALRDSVIQGADFGDIALRHSQDPSAQQQSAKHGYRGHLGQFTAGRMVLAFEDAAYNTPIGEMSQPFRSSFGYHVLFVHDRFPAPPDIEISHLLVQIKGTTPEDTVNALQLIASYQERLAAGLEFAKVAGAFSDDRQSGQYGGRLGRIRHDNPSLPESFRDAAFALENVGDVSDAVETPFGFHLIHLDSKTTLGTFEEEYESLRHLANRLPRMREAERQFASTARADYVSTLDTTLVISLVKSAHPDSVEVLIEEAASDSVLAWQTVATLGDSTYTVGQLAAFVESGEHQFRNQDTGAKQAIGIADAFLNHAAVTHDAMKLEATDVEFATIMQEFRDGLMLFKLMEDSVWTPAQTDSTLQQAHFAANAEQYQFPDRRRHIQIYSYSDSLLHDALTRFDSASTPEEFKEFIYRDSVRHVLVDTVLVVGPSQTIHDHALGLAEGERTEFLEYQLGNVVIYFDGIEPARPKTLQEARAAVGLELQALLEERLLEQLRAKYRVRTFPSRVKNAFTSDG